MSSEVGASNVSVIFTGGVPEGTSRFTTDESGLVLVAVSGLVLVAVNGAEPSVIVKVVVYWVFA